MGKPRGYTEVKTPQLYDSALFKTSGHWEKFQEEMFITESAGAPYGLKPMNCPGHAQLYSMTPHSYRDLPVRYSEPGLLHRNEPSGTLHGLLRTRNFVQDDAHIFCTEDQIQEEVAGCLEFAFATYKVFGVDVRLELSTRPEKRLGTDEQWDRSEGALRSALESQGLEYTVNEGDGAFYGAKIDMHMTDSLGRSWQLGTVQLDYLQPERFGLVYTGADNVEHRPVMIHRALMGSYERFIGIFLEHVGGELPVWLSPVQAIVLPIADRHLEYALHGQRAPATRPACAPSSTTAPSRWGARSATPSCARSPTCSSSATARPSRKRSACASIAPGIPGRSRCSPSPSGCWRSAKAARWAEIAAILAPVDPTSHHTARPRLIQTAAARS